MVGEGRGRVCCSGSHAKNRHNGMNFFNDMVTISRMRALALSHEAGMYAAASRHEEKKDVLWPVEDKEGEDERNSD